ncbi:MAG: Ig-like domain-containing protein, partial [Tannerella sp.]|nr:Ig-like domain-containing protein [Tannerella sp.]
MTVSEIEISPNPVPVLEIGRTVELTATVAPANATEDLRWVVYDEAVVSVEGDGPKALLTAKKAGTTRIFATNRTGIVVSEELTVKVNSAEYAGYVTGNYLGDARISGALNVDISGVGVSLTRVGREPATVKLVVVANVPNMGELTITGEEVMVAPG